MVEVGFEPTPPERLELESSALDHSAIQPSSSARLPTQTVATGLDHPKTRPPVASKMCAVRESNPGLVRGRDLYYHCTNGAALTSTTYGLLHRVISRRDDPLDHLSPFRRAAWIPSRLDLRGVPRFAR